MESVSTMYYNNNPNLIMIYCGIQGDEEDFITEYYLIYDAQKNTMDRINKWNVQQYKSMGKNWKSYIFKKTMKCKFNIIAFSRIIIRNNLTI